MYRLKFTIRAEKCPNRSGVEAILHYYRSEVIGFRKLGGICTKCFPALIPLPLAPDTIPLLAKAVRMNTAYGYPQRRKLHQSNSLKANRPEK